MFSLSPKYKGRQRRRQQKYQETGKWTLSWIFQEKHFWYQITENLNQNGNLLVSVMNRTRNGASWISRHDLSLSTGPVQLHTHSLGWQIQPPFCHDKDEKNRKSASLSAIPIKVPFQFDSDYLHSIEPTTIVMSVWYSDWPQKETH